MQCESCATCAVTRLSSLNESEQPIIYEAGPKNPHLQKAFYYYDTKEGTKLRLVNATATVAASTAAGGLSSFLLTAYLPQLDITHNSIFARSVMELEYALPGSAFSLATTLGAAVGFAGACWLVHSAHQGGMKPRTAAAVRGIMNGLIHQVEGDFKAIQQYKTSIQADENELIIRKEAMQAEKQENRLRAEEAYEKEKRHYDKVVTGLSGELKGYLNQVFNSLDSPNRLPSYEEAVSNTRRGGTYQLGQDVANFIERKDFSWLSRERFLRSLIPHLNEEEMKGVREILNRFPYCPVYWPQVGPLEQEYDNISARCEGDQRKMGKLERSVRELTSRFSCFELGPDGKVKVPSVADFREYLPD